MMSEIADLRNRIELECQALRSLMEDFRQTAPHHIIQSRFESITPLQKQLSAHIGDEEAARMVVETYIRVIG
ncbi:hypothetical protein [Dictyobacter kobayashii]|uniref:Uncharacterized protein n=1 Tax=Dictyobacter kobayashii TaxID=2014872 RepID=A0A402ACC0_9CHLR|nr:hypothetical protein [Dictyobacter kobayashii]GCE16747.1 hypothetical protein KDK_05470 [Dictyobacter kobayashii]